MLLAIGCERDPLTNGPTAEEVSANSVPRAVAVTPASGESRTQRFVVEFFDADGAATFEWAQFLVNTELKGEAGCYVQWERNGNAFYLMNDAATKLSGPLVSETAGTLQNSQCKLDGSQSRARVEGRDLELTLALEFEPSFQGSQRLFVRAQDELGSAAEWREIGTWSLR